jgi:hypothetical protein
LPLVLDRLDGFERLDLFDLELEVEAISGIGETCGRVCEDVETGWKGGLRIASLCGRWLAELAGPATTARLRPLGAILY